MGCADGPGYIRGPKPITQNVNIKAVYITAAKLKEGPIERTYELDDIYLKQGMHIDQAKIIRILGGTTRSVPFFYNDTHYIRNGEYERVFGDFMHHLQGNGADQTRSEQQWQPVLEVQRKAAEIHESLRLRNVDLECELETANEEIARLEGQLEAERQLRRLPNEER